MIDQLIGFIIGVMTLMAFPILLTVFAKGLQEIHRTDGRSVLWYFFLWLILMLALLGVWLVICLIRAAACLYYLFFF